MAFVEEPSLTSTLRRWWSDERERNGFWRTLGNLAELLWQFARESTPAHRQQRYGDVDYDWDFRVDTTSATVGWRDRLLGLFHSPYQPTDRALFHEMLGSLNIDFRDFTFIDIGSGKGRSLLLASDYPFQRILGVELLPALDRIAKENIRKYKSESQRCLVIETICADARHFAFPAEPTVLYLFNPLPRAALTEMLRNLEHSLRDHPRQLFVLYHNPLLERILSKQAWLQKKLGTDQYVLFTARAAAETDYPSK